MTSVYAESSAVLEWLLGSEQGGRVREILSRADRVVTSDLTSVEVQRTLRRLSATGHLSAEQRQAVSGAYATAAARWAFRVIDAAVLARAGEAFAMEPVRTLDGLHLATASLHASTAEPVVVCSLDERLRQNAKALGLDVAPGPT